MNSKALYPNRQCLTPCSTHYPGLTNDCTNN